MRSRQDNQLTESVAADNRRETAWAMAVGVGVERSGTRRQCDRQSALADHTDLDRAAVAARVALEEVAEAAAMAAARALSVAKALNEALAVLDVVAGADSEPAAPLTPLRHGLLSPREEEVLALVADGRSTKAIAAELFVSPNTIKTHIASLMNKLHVDTRAQLAAIATRHALSMNTPRRSPSDYLA
jgi:DNA-binding CsgD family transcriptional regulator